MAGWIALDKNVRDKPEFVVAQSILDIDPDRLVGKLHSLWSWFDDQTSDGFLPRVTAKMIDARIGVDGFAAAMAEAGWLILDSTGARMPSFDKRHSNSEHTRLANARRQARFRENRKSGQPECSHTDDDSLSGRDSNVTQALRSVTEASPTQHNTTQEDPSFLPSFAAGKRALAKAAADFVKKLPPEWGKAIKSVRESGTKLANTAIQAAAESGHTPEQVVAIVEFARKHRQRFENPKGALVDRLTTVGPEVPISEGWSVDIPGEAQPKPQDRERDRQAAIARTMATERCSPGRAAEIVDEQLARASA